jgi:hypothetical protein
VRRDHVTSLDKISVLRKSKIDLPMCGIQCVAAGGCGCFLAVGVFWAVSVFVAKLRTLSDNALYGVVLWAVVAKHFDKR